LWRNLSKFITQTGLYCSKQLETTLWKTVAYHLQGTGCCCLHVGSLIPVHIMWGCRQVTFFGQKLSKIGQCILTLRLKWRWSSF